MVEGVEVGGVALPGVEQLLGAGDPGDRAVPEGPQVAHDGAGGAGDVGVDGAAAVEPGFAADDGCGQADLDEAKATEALRRAEEARRTATDKQEIAAVEGELAMLAAQLSAIRKLRKK